MGLEKDLLKRMEGYRYGRFNLLKNEFYFKYFLDGGLEIKNFYLGDKFGEGDCVKLTNDFCIKNKDLNLLKVEGKEPRYFNSDNANHIYSLFYEKKLPKHFWKFGIDEKIDFVNKSDFYIVDPSFKLIKFFRDSGYEIDNFFNGGLINPNSLDLFLENYTGVPLGVNSNNELLYLGKLNNKVSLHFQNIFYKDINKSIYLNETSRIRGNLLGEDDLQSICVNLSKKYVEFLDSAKKFNVLF